MNVDIEISAVKWISPRRNGYIPLENGFRQKEMVIFCCKIDFAQWKWLYSAGKWISPKRNGYIPLENGYFREEK